MDVDSLRIGKPHIAVIKDVFDEIDDVYSYKDFPMDVVDSKSLFMEIDNRSQSKNKMETEDSSQKNNILCQSLCLFCENQWNAINESNVIINKSRIKHSESVLSHTCTCGPTLNSTVDKPEFTRDINQVALLSPEISFETDFHDRLWNAEDINKLDLNLILGDDVAQAIYKRGVCDGINMNCTNEFYSKELLRKHNLSVIKKKILKKQKSNQELLRKKDYSRKKSFEGNDTIKSSTDIPNDNTLQQHFSILDNINVSYLPLPAMQLMIDSELSNINRESCKTCSQITDGDSKKCVHDKSIPPEKKNKQSKPYSKSTRNKAHTVCKKNVLTNKCANNNYQLQLLTLDKIEIIETDPGDEKDVETGENVKSSDSKPIIPLSVIHFMDELESTQNKIINTDVNEESDENL